MVRLTRLGLVVTALGLGMLGLGAASISVIVAGMFVQGCGQGLFQVANFDLVTGALPARDRGVAGSLAMLTRTFGLVLGATLLMLLMQMLAGADAVAGIAGTYLVAAVVPLGLLAVGWCGRFGAGRY